MQQKMFSFLGFIKKKSQVSLPGQLHLVFSIASTEIANDLFQSVACSILFPQIVGSNLEHTCNYFQHKSSGAQKAKTSQFGNFPRHKHIFMLQASQANSLTEIIQPRIETKS